MRFDAVFINGTVGAGKSAVADALGDSLIAEGVPHAVVDLDHIRRSWPRPESDPFNHELELENLGALATNFRSGGAQRFVLAGVIEDPAEIPRYESALGGAEMFVCRLTADPAVLRSRLARRHAGDPGGLGWHLRRVGELEEILRRAGSDHIVLDSSEATPSELAVEVRAAAGW